MSKIYGSSARSMNARVTPQMQRTPGIDEVKNNANAYTFVAGKWENLKRFIILGSEGGTYYVGEKKLTRENAQNAETCIRENGKKVVDMCIEISDAGRAPKNDPAIFVLAMCAGLGTQEVRMYAMDNLQKVCRTGTHLFHFVDYVLQFRGSGSGFKRALAKWYTNRSPKSLVNQLVKYQSRDGWSHKDVLRVCHPVTDDHNKNSALRWAVGKSLGLSTGPEFGSGISVSVDDPLAMIWAYEGVKKAFTENEVVQLVTKYSLPLEAIPTEKQTQRVLAAALPNLGITAIIRNLGRFSKEGILTPSSAETQFVVEKLLNAELLKEGRVHPLMVLFALNTYKSGHGFRGSSTWNVVSRIVDAMDEAFYLAFGFVMPTNLRILLALDVSGSMFMESYSTIAGTNVLAGEAAAAMAMVTARTERNYEIVGFTKGGAYSRPSMHYGYPSGISPLDISPRRRLDDICNYTKHLPFGGTDCALPMIYAKEAKKQFDAFVIYTDNETWAGDIKPFQALRQYRDTSGINARCVVVGMTATGFTIADSSDNGMLDVVGFDTATPNVISDFVSGNL